MTLMKPEINPNGMSRDAHVDARRKAMEAILEAMEALGDLRPHGRDYQTLSNAKERYEADLAIHQERIAALDKMRNEVLEEALEIQKGE